MANLVQSDFWDQKVLNTLFPPQWSGLYVALFQNNLTPLHTNVLSAFTECNFAGYAAVVFPTFGTAFFDGTTQLWTITAPVITYTSTDSSNQNVYGYVVINASTIAAATEWYFAQNAPSPPVIIGPTAPVLGLIPSFVYTDD